MLPRRTPVLKILPVLTLFCGCAVGYYWADRRPHPDLKLPDKEFDQKWLTECLPLVEAAKSNAESCWGKARECAKNRSDRYLAHKAEAEAWEGLHDQLLALKVKLRFRVRGNLVGPD